jgi:hypothetical protein
VGVAAAKTEICFRTAVLPQSGQSGSASVSRCNRSNRLSHAKHTYS